MEQVFVTQSGYEALLKRKDELVAQLRASQFDKGRAAAGDSNSWHDNAEYDMHARNEVMLAEQVAKIMSLIEKVSIVQSPTHTETVAVGHMVTLRTKDGELKVYEVGGFGETDLQLSPKKLSYDAPMLREFFGKPIGHSSTVKTGEKMNELLLVDIRLQ
jgi:transcription elongation GreA/GreB family factor